jgi:hypothetical protein
LLCFAALANGRQLLDRGRWNIDQFRDERAADIESRLERNEPIVKNPF